MSIGSIGFLSIVHSKMPTLSGPFKLTFVDENDDVDDNAAYSRHLSIRQLQELRSHIGNLLIGVGELPAESAPTSAPTVPKPTVKTFGVKSAPTPVKSAVVDDSDEDGECLDDDEEARPAKVGMKMAPYAPYRSGAMAPRHIGDFVDRVANNKRRDPRRVATRVLEEMVELVLATGATTQMVWSAVSDAIHNQALKASAYGRTVFPSQLVEVYGQRSVLKEIADVRLVLLDLQHVTHITVTSVEAEMSRKLRHLQANGNDFVTDGHTFYLKKPHVNAPATSL